MGNNLDAQLKTFLTLTMPFGPNDDHNLWKCVTVIYPKFNDKSQNITRNCAAQSFDDVVDLIDGSKYRKDTAVYLALGAQKIASTDRYANKTLKAIRKRENMVSFKCFYCDIDVGKNNCYATTADAEQGLRDFLRNSGMPDPTFLVYSGSGGFHVYWCTFESMPIAQWQPLANALKAAAAQHGFLIDPTVTADAARIMRVPTTFNHKANKVVVTLALFGEALPVYQMSDLATALSQYVNVSTIAQKTGSGTVSPITKNFTSGLDERALPKLTIDEIAVNCPMTAQTLADGGVGKSEPDWSQDMFLAAWTSDPYNAAHRLSCHHAGYDKAATDKKVNEKLAAIQANPALGWPSCTSFHHSACQSCPVRSLNRSPVFFGHNKTMQAQPVQPKVANDPLMPPNYWRNINNHVFFNTDNGPVDVLGYPILDGGIDTASGELVIKTRIGGIERWGSMAVGKQTPVGICEALTKGTANGIHVRREAQKIAGTFIMAWVTHLQENKRRIEASSYGWAGNSFVYGDQQYHPGGSVVAYRGKNIDDNFRCVGDLKPWQDAMQLVYGSTALELLVATAFAAPLVSMVIDNSLVVSVFSHKTGFGKSTGVRLGQSVWGHPRNGISMLDDTANAFMQKLTMLRNLPVYWDELKTKDQIDKLVQIVFATTQGRSKARLTRDSNPMPINSATTMFAVASNHGISAAVIRNTSGTEAGGKRVFEFEADGIVNKVANSEQLLLPLTNNYGAAGSKYVEFLVVNKKTVEQVLKQIDDNLHAACSFLIDERFWRYTMVTILAGAMLANAAGLATFDTDAIKKMLVTKLIEQRQRMIDSQIYTLAGKESAQDVLSVMLSETNGRSLIVTDTIPMAIVGKPVNVPVEYFDPSRAHDVWVQRGRLDGRILARISGFDDWMQKHNHSAEQIISGLRNDYFIVKRRTSIGVGVRFMDNINARFMCWDMTPKPSRTPADPSATPGSGAQI